MFDELLDKLNSFEVWDFQVDSFDGWHLRIIGGFTLSYPDSYHFEAVFSGVSYISCPTEFSHAKFRLATPPERFAIARVVSLEPRDHVFAIEAESSGSHDPSTFFISAEGLSVAPRLSSAS